MGKKIKHFYEFDSFRLDVGERLLLHNGKQVPLTIKAFDTLLALVEDNGRIVNKDELLKKVWPETFVEEVTLARNISTLRKALGESKGHPKFIETLPKRGYRFIATVTEYLDKELEANLLESKTQIDQDEQPAEIRNNSLPFSQGFSMEKPANLRIIAESEHAFAKVKDSNIDLAAQTSLNVSKRERWKAKWPFILACGMFVGAIVAVFYFGSFGKTKPQNVAQIKSIIVLPFKPLDTDARDESFELGMADTLITKLSKVREIIVRPTSAVRKYMSLDQDPIAAGQEQRVDAVLDGSIQKSGERMRVTVRLIRVEDGSPLWAFKCDEQCTDIFIMQDNISDQVIAAFNLELSANEKRLLARHDTENVEAYQAYLKGRYFWNRRTKEGMKKASDFFEQAIKLDPNYARAYVGLADCYFLADLSPLPIAESTAKAKSAVMEAFKLDNWLVEAYTSMAWIKYGEWDWVGSEQAFKQAIEIDPNYATAHHWYAFLLSSLSRHQESLKEIEQAQQLDPLSLVINTNLGSMLVATHQYDQAIIQFLKTIEMDPTFARAHYNLGSAYALKGQYQQAISEIQKSYDLTDGEPSYLGGLGYAYALSGNKAEVQKILGKMLDKYNDPSEYLHDCAGIYLALGDKDHAIERLQKVYENHWPALAESLSKPKWDNLRDDPRFQKIIHGMGLPILNH